MDNISTLFGVPLYVVDIEPSEISDSISYIHENIDAMKDYASESKVGHTKWTSKHSILPFQIPQICDKVIEHSSLYAGQVGISLEYSYTYWINRWIGNNPECTNDRHSHTNAKIVATLYVSNNEPTDATLRLENPMQNTLAFTPFHNMAGKPWWKQIVDVEAHANRLVLWPGFLWHWARYTNNPDSYRISMAVEIN